MGTPFESRFMRRAGADPQGFAAAVRQRYGFDPSGVTALLKIASRLNDGAMIGPSDIRQLKALHPSVDAHTVEHLASEINNLPAAQRGDAFIGVLANDAAAVQGDHVRASSEWHEVRQLAADFAVQEIADAINSKRDGGVDTAPSVFRPEPEPGSTRALLEAQLTDPGQRLFAQALDAGDPATINAAKEVLGSRIEGAVTRLEAPPEGDGIRDALSASFDLHEGADLARDHFGVEP